MSMQRVHRSFGLAALFAMGILPFAPPLLAAPTAWNLQVIDSVDVADNFSMPANYQGNVVWTRRSGGSLAGPGADSAGVLLRRTDGTTSLLISPLDAVPGSQGQQTFGGMAFSELRNAVPSISQGLVAVRLQNFDTGAGGCAPCASSGYYSYGWSAPYATSLNLVLDDRTTLPGGSSAVGGRPSLEAGFGPLMAFYAGGAIYDALDSGKGLTKLFGPGQDTHTDGIPLGGDQPVPVVLGDIFGANPVINYNKLAGFPPRVDTAFYATGTMFIGGVGAVPMGGVYIGSYIDDGSGTRWVLPVADSSTRVPGGAFDERFIGGSFTSLSPDIDNGTVVFYGAGAAGSAGLYLSSPGGGLQVVADLHTAIPGGMGNFTGFGYMSIDQGRVVFEGRGINGQEGLYLWSQGVLSKVVDLSDLALMFPDEAGIPSMQFDAALGFFHEGFSGDTVAFTLETLSVTGPGAIDMQHHGRVILASLGNAAPEPASLWLLGGVALASIWRRRQSAAK